MAGVQKCELLSSWRLSVADPFAGSGDDLVGDAGEDDAGVEEEQALDVEGALVVEKFAPTGDDHLRHDKGEERFVINGEVSDVAEEGVANVAIGRLDCLEW